MLLKFALFMVISTSVLAQDNCGRVQTSLFDIERSIYNSNLGNTCERTSARSLGVTENLQSFVDEHRCKNLSEIELELGSLEADIVMIDGLRALKDEVMKTQSELRNRTQWTLENHQLARSMVRDVALGASIEELLNSDHLPALFENAQIEGPRWISHIRSFCQTQETSGAVSPFCSSWKTYGPQTNNDRNSVILPEDVIDFMDDLRGSLNPQRQVPADTKAQFLAQLQVSINGVESNFSSLSSMLDQVDLSNMLTRIDHDRSRFTNEQVIFIQNLNIEDVSSGSNTYITRLRERFKQRRDQANIELQRNLLRQGFADEADRLNARVKAKFQSAMGRPVALAPCLNLDDNELANCIEQAMPDGSDRQVNRLKQSLVSAARKAAEARNLGEVCSRPEMLNAFIEDTSEANACKEKIALNRADLLDKRKALLALRGLVAENIEQDLRFRDAAFEYLKNNCRNISTGDLQRPECRGIATITTDPMMKLASDTMFALQGGLRATTVLTDRDCPEGNDNEYVILCEIIHRGENTPTAITPAYRGTPQTLSTDVSSRPDDGLVRDALAAAVNDVGQAILQRRFPPQNLNRGFQMPPFRPMPYSSPINMSMSDYVMTTAKFYGGYGQYYQCTTCGFGSSPAAFNTYWGLTTTPMPGMGSTGLMGANLSSRFFGGSTVSSPSLAGAFNF